jgi:uroporphyrinogen-III synthase
MLQDVHDRACKKNIMDTNILHNINVMVTRPKELADNLCELIKNAGGVPICYPALEIREPGTSNSREFVSNNIHAFSMAIFISPTAVTRTLQYMHSLPENLRIAAIGSRTAETLAQAGIHTDILPDGHDSESLLAHPEMQADKIHGSNVIVFRGEGGRTLLGDTLTSRGANVVYAEMYRRAKPEPESDSEQKLQHADVVSATSNEGLLNLLDMVNDKTLLRSLPLIVPGGRCEQMAKMLGFKSIVVADNATDNATFDALKAWSSKHSGKSEQTTTAR